MSLKKYKCHKEVEAAKIVRVEYMSLKEAGETETNPDGAMLYVDGTAPPIFVNQKYIEKHSPQAGGYFVIYEGGYTSFSPADAFESGYALIQDEGFEQRLLKERNGLEANIERLGAFMDSDNANDVSDSHIALLLNQIVAMTKYKIIIEKRIELLDIK